MSTDSKEHLSQLMDGELSGETGRQHQELKQFLYKNLYRHKRVMRMSDNAREVVATLFKAYLDDPDLLPEKVREGLAAAGSEGGEAARARLIGDYIAGMTDRFAIHEAERVA